MSTKKGWRGRRRDVAVVETADGDSPGTDTVHHCWPWQWGWERGCGPCGGSGTGPGKRWRKTHRTSVQTHTRNNTLKKNILGCESWLCGLQMYSRWRSVQSVFWISDQTWAVRSGKKMFLLNLIYYFFFFYYSRNIHRSCLYAEFWTTEFILDLLSSLTHSINSELASVGVGVSLSFFAETCDESVSRTFILCRRKIFFLFFFLNYSLVEWCAWKWRMKRHVLLLRLNVSDVFDLLTRFCPHWALMYAVCVCVC